MQDFETIVTKIGLAKIANAAALGKKIDLQYMAFGDGNGEYPAISDEQTELVNEVYRGNINNVEVIEDTTIKITKIIPPTDGGFWVREIGVFDSDNDLIAVGTYPATEKPSIEQGATTDLAATVLIRIANTDAVVLKIDPTVTLATIKDLQELKEDIENEVDYLNNQLNTKINNHIEDTVLNPKGIHGIRIQRGKIEYKSEDGEWEIVAGGDSPSFADVEDISIKEGDGEVEIKWSDPQDVIYEGIILTKWKGTRLIRKEGGFPANENDGQIVVENGVRDQYKNTPFIDKDLENGKTYYYLLIPFSDDGQYTVSKNNQFNASPSDKDDLTGSPGNGKLLKGTMEEGYFGSVPSNDLISGNELAKRLNVTQGTAQYSDTPWHKFAYKNKILFVAQKTIRNSISWDHLNDKDIVYGNKTIEIDGIKYKVRLLKGALTDPSDYDASDRGAKGSEWNRLVAPLNHQRKDNSWDYPAYMESDLQDWETYLDDKEMTVRDVDGRYSWCQETSGSNSAFRVRRGGYGVSSSAAYSSSLSSSSYGWRPVLEVI